MYQNRPTSETHGYWWWLKWPVSRHELLLKARKVLLWNRGKKPYTINWFLFYQNPKSDFYCQQLDRLKVVIGQKQPTLSTKKGNCVSGSTHQCWLASSSERLFWGILMHHFVVRCSQQAVTICSCLWRMILLVPRRNCEKLLFQLLCNRDKSNYGRVIKTLCLKKKCYRVKWFTLVLVSKFKAKKMDLLDLY